MGTDQFIILVSKVSSYLLPVAGLVLLIFLILFFKNLIMTLKTLNQTLTQATQMVEDCNVQINKLDAPLNTISEISQTVDNVHEKTKGAITTVITVLIANLGLIRDKFAEKKEKKAETAEETVESETCNNE